MNSGNWRLIVGDLSEHVIYNIDERDPNDPNRLRPVATVHDTQHATLVLYAREMEAALQRIWKATEHTYPQLEHFDLMGEPNQSSQRAAAAAAEVELNRARDAVHAILLAVK